MPRTEPDREVEEAKGSARRAEGERTEPVALVEVQVQSQAERCEDNGQRAPESSYRNNTRRHLSALDATLPNDAPSLQHALQTACNVQRRRRGRRSESGLIKTKDSSLARYSTIQTIVDGCTYSL